MLMARRIDSNPEVNIAHLEQINGFFKTISLEGTCNELVSLKPKIFMIRELFSQEATLPTGINPSRK